MNKRIILAEDDSNLGTLLRNYLAAKNYDTTLFMSGRSVLESFSAGMYDLCILDIMMPEMDGLALAKAIRNIEPAIPIVFLTAKNQEEDIIEGFRTGCRRLYYQTIFNGGTPLQDRGYFQEDRWFRS